MIHVPQLHHPQLVMVRETILQNRAGHKGGTQWVELCHMTSTKMKCLETGRTTFCKLHEHITWSHNPVTWTMHSKYWTSHIQNQWLGLCIATTYMYSNYHRHCLANTVQVLWWIIQQCTCTCTCVCIQLAANSVRAKLHPPNCHRHHKPRVPPTNLRQLPRDSHGLPKGYPITEQTQQDDGCTPQSPTAS